MTPEQELARLRAENEEQRRSISTLQASIAELQKQLAEAIGGNKELKLQLSDMQDKLDRLLFQIEKRNKKDYGKKTERHNPRQGETASPESSKSGDPSTEKKKNQNHKKNINSQKVPVAQKEHLVSPEERTCPSCLIDTEIFSQKITSQLERLTHSLVRLEHHQEVRSCPKCKQYVVTAKKPEPPFPGCLAGPHLLGSIIVGKLADGCPNYRQEKIFKRELAIIPRSTQCDWIIAASLTLEPLYECLKQHVLQSKIIQTDDTWGKVQDRTHPDNIRKIKMTPYIGDRHHRSIVFDYSPDLSFESNRNFVKQYAGYVQVDGSNGFDAFFLDGTRIEVGCNTHARRKADEAKSAEPADAEEILDLYSKLYKIEDEVRHEAPELRLSRRQKESKPLMLLLHQKLLALSELLNPTNPLRDHVDYTLKRWIALTRFLDDPDFEIDTNPAERAIKIFVLLRKNAMFFGSDRGGRAAAIHLSFIASCLRNNVDPVAYFTDVFTRINSMKTSDLEQLLPDRWIPVVKPPP